MKITERGLNHGREKSVLRQPWQGVTVDVNEVKLERRVGSRQRKMEAGLGLPRRPHFLGVSGGKVVS